MRSAWVLTAIMCAACGQQRPAQEDEMEAEPPSIVTDTTRAADGAVPGTCEELHERILRTAATRAAVAVEFGPADSVISTTEPNRHVPNAVDSLFVVFYPGLTMNIRAPQGGRDLATHVAVEDNRFLAYPGIGIGAPAARLMEVLGEPESADGTSVTYDCSMAVEQPVTFRIHDGRIDRVEISYYVD